MEKEKDKEMTIIIPVRNREDSVAASLDSISAQAYRPLNLIIVDNGSTDRTPEIIKHWSEKHINDQFSIRIISEPRKGATSARNAGLKETETDFVMFFDSDDIMEEDHLQRIMSHLHAHPETELLHWSISIRDMDGWTNQKHSIYANDLLAEHILHGTLATARFCVRTETVRNIGGWNESLSTWDDLELGVRLIKAIAPGKIHRLNGSPRVIANISDDSLTGASFSSRAEAQMKALDEINRLISDENRMALILASRRAILAAQYRREGCRSLAKQEFQKATDGRTTSERIKLRLIYAVQRLSGQGGSAVAMQLFRPIEETAPNQAIG